VYIFDRWAGGGVLKYVNMDGCLAPNKTKDEKGIVES
jgi:hypothetical protein